MLTGASFAVEAGTIAREAGASREDPVRFQRAVVMFLPDVMELVWRGTAN
jgi:hypothetical protein